MVTRAELAYHLGAAQMSTEIANIFNNKALEELSQGNREAAREYMHIVTLVLAKGSIALAKLSELSKELFYVTRRS